MGDARIDMGLFMDKVKGGKKRKRVGGDKSRTLAEEGSGQLLLAGPLVNLPIKSTKPEFVPVKFRSDHDSCVPYSLLNLIDASNNMRRKLMRVFGSTKGNLYDLARSVDTIPELFKKFTLSGNISGKHLNWIVEQKEGKYIVLSGVHCVAVDCERQLVFDCVEDFFHG